MPIQNLLGVPIVILSTLDDINIDLMEQVNVQHQSTITQNPTETGRNVTDHIVNLPVVITMAGRFVDTPFATGVQAFNPLQPFISAFEGFGGGVSIQQWETLENLRGSRRLFDVVIQQGVYEDMAFRSLSAPRTKGDGTSQRFQAEMIQVVTTGVNALSIEGITSPDVAHSSGSDSNVGPQSTSPFFGTI